MIFINEFKRIRVVYSRNDGTSGVTGEFFIPLDADYITDGNINAYIDGRLKQYPEEKLLFIIFQETSQIVSKNDDNIIYLDYLFL